MVAGGYFDTLTYDVHQYTEAEVDSTVITPYRYLECALGFVGEKQY